MGALKDELDQKFEDGTMTNLDLCIFWAQVPPATEDGALAELAELKATLAQAKINDQAYWVAQNILTSQLLEQNKTLARLHAELDAKNTVIKEILEAAKDNGLPNFRKAIEDTLAAKKVIEQVKHDGDIFDHLRGFAGYIKASAYLAAHPEETK